jgi:glycosyltransferase involved in cell wall biosynthesis
MEKPRALIVLPCYNEAPVLAPHVERIVRHCEGALAAYDWTLLIADNASSDGTGTIGRQLADRHDRVEYAHLAEKGRGNILRHVWLEREADIYAYMDADLATDLAHLAPLLDAVRDGADVAVGCRLVPGARVIGRNFSREIASRGYNLCLKIFFRVRFRDAQCGFKAVSRRVRDRIVPLTRDNRWFFDSEVLILSEKNGRTLREIPVTWEDHQGRESKVKLLRDILYFLRRIGGLRRRLWLDRELTTKAQRTQRGSER